MAVFLIKTTDATHPDPTIDKQGCYKKGDIVDVQEDDFQWGAEETLPTFYRVRITGLSVTDAKRYMDSHVDGNTHQVLKRRLYRVNLKRLPRAVTDQLAATGFYGVAWESVRRYVENSITGVSE